MEAYIKNLGRTAVSCEGEHNSSREFNKCSIVYIIVNDVVKSFISRKYVPKNIDLGNREYWQPFGFTLIYE